MQKPISLILLILILATGIAWAEKAKGWFEKGNSAMEAGYYNVAIKCFEKAITIDPDDSETHLRMGHVYNKKSNTKKAISYYKKAIAIDPDFARAHYSLGTVYDKKGKLDKAISEFKKSIAINPNLAEAHRELGSAYNEKKMYDEAVTELKRAVELDHNDSQAHSQIGIAYLAKGVDSAAAKHLYRAGLLFLKQGDKRSALKAYEDLKRTKSKELELSLFKKLN